MICGEEKYCRAITSHLRNVHSFTEHDFIDYHFKYIRNEGQGICKCKNCNKKTPTAFQSNTKGLKIRYQIFCEDHTYCSRMSPVNLQYWKDIFGMSDEEAETARRPYIDISAKGLKEGYSEKKYFNPTQLEYWLKKTGGDLEEAKKLLNERQTTFSKEICIEQHGETEGTEKWKNRQNKWRETMNSKSVEEIERINKSKMFKTSYSKISQELFISIYERIKNDFSVGDIYFATLQKDGTVRDTGFNNEFFLYIGNGKHRLLDFYIKSKNKCIEYNGEFFHYGEWAEKNGSKQREILREEDLKKHNINVLHIRERDYNNDKEGTVQQCLRFIYE
jgi:hypothetical protein